MAKTAIASAVSTRICRAPKSAGPAPAGVGSCPSATNSCIQSMYVTVGMLQPNATGTFSTTPWDEPATGNSHGNLAVPESPHEALEKIESGMTRRGIDLCRQPNEWFRAGTRHPLGNAQECIA